MKAALHPSALHLERCLYSRLIQSEGTRQTFLQRRFVFTEKLLINNWSRGTEEEGRVEKTQGLQENFFTEELRVKRKPDIH